MRFRVFTYGIPPDEELTELNSFLSSRRVLSVRNELVENNKIPYLLFIVEYLESGTVHQALERPPKVDYREKLSEEDFERFSRLRDLRKEIAERDGVPVYAVFTNAQLAEMVERRTLSMAALQEIPGIGAGKVEKYGSEFLVICRKLFPDGGGHETDT